MRLDKWLKFSRILKRRTVAQMACEQGRVYVNDRIAKPAATLKVGDLVHIELGRRALTVCVQQTPEKAPSIQDSTKLYELVEVIERPREAEYGSNSEAEE